MRNTIIMLLLLLVAAGGADAKKRDKRVRIEFQTTMGNFTVALFKDTPIHSANFEKLVREGFYDGLLFHRVIAKFMVQAGDPDSRDAKPGQTLGEGGPDYTLQPEIDLPYHYHYRGALAMAREGDDVNPQRRSCASQFYIVWGTTFSARQLAGVRDQVDEATGIEGAITPDMAQDYAVRGGTPHLDGQYTVFGEVVEGLSVIGQMQKVATGKNDRPLEDVRIIKATVLK